MRNLPDYRFGFAELTRVVRPGGRVVCLEIARPRSLAGRLGGVWFERAVPLIGRLVGQAEAYRYLVASVRSYPPPDQVARFMARSRPLERLVDALDLRDGHDPRRSAPRE